MEQDITSEALPETSGVDVTGSNEAVVGSAENPSETPPGVAKVLSEALGKSFETDEQALKSVQDTFSYVNEAAEFNKAVKSLSQQRGISRNEARLILMENLGNAMGEEQAPASVPQPTVKDTPHIDALLEKVNDMEFFTTNPEMKKHEPLLREFRGSSGKTFDEILKSEIVKQQIAKADAHDEMENKKSVLRPNSRLGQASDKMSEAAEAKASGNLDLAKSKAVGAVVDLINDLDAR